MASHWFHGTGGSVLLAFVRPTVLANQFVNLVEAGELQRAESLLIRPNKPFKDDVMETEPVVVEARLQPRTWSNLFRMQRELEGGIMWMNR